MQTPAFWQHDTFLSRALLPLSFLYGFGAKRDRINTEAHQAPLPVISVGNVTAGGAGKTPTAIALIKLLRNMGHTPHVISRGYGGSIRTTHRVGQADTAAHVGDEPLLLAKHAPTWIGRDRLSSAIAAKNNGADMVIADDGLQHHRLKKNISFLVIDGEYGLGNGRLLPAGPLRETLHDSLERTDAVILIGEDRTQLLRSIDKPVFTATVEPEGDINTLKSGRYLAFAGLARPQKFYDTLHQQNVDVVATQDFPDHHTYTTRDLDTLLDAAKRSNATLITTTKDAVKIPPSYRDRIQVLEITLRFAEPNAIQNWLQSALSVPI